MTGLLYGLGRACARWLWCSGSGSCSSSALVIVAQGPARDHQQRDPAGHREPERHRPPQPLPEPGLRNESARGRHRQRQADRLEVLEGHQASVSALKKTPHVTAAVSPLSDAGSNALSKDKKIGYISVALDVGQGITEDEGNAVLDAADPAKKAGLQVAVGGYVGQELSSRTPGPATRSGFRRDGDPAARLRLGRGDGAADPHRRARPAVRPERRDAPQPHRRHPHDRPRWRP